MTEISPAYKAVLHIVRRVQIDASFAWCMTGTEGLRLCFEAIAEHNGEPVDSVREQIESRAASLKETPEIVELRNRVSELENTLSSGDDVSGNFVPQPEPELNGFELREQLERLLFAAECGQALSPENLRAVLEGARADIVLCNSGAP